MFTPFILFLHSFFFDFFPPLPLSTFMANQPGIVPSSAEFELPRDIYAFFPADDVELLVADSMILSLPLGKFGIYLMTFDDDLCLPLTDFQ